ncbi:MAG: N-acetylmuramoyl-L-alanine amidase [Lachnospiraceae bacterium]|nr:N-acetylmuramoyl-L-alanine amidase [Lachnospiraceae bacterium]
MKKHAEVWMSLLLILIVFLCATNLKKLVTNNVAKQTIVVIDAGHGGVDPGKVAVNNTLEKDINLSIALLVKEKLAANGITVVMTRESDKGLYPEDCSNKKSADMQNRCSIIEASDCLLTVSIHQNSYHEEDVSGPQVFYYKNSDNGKALAEMLQTKLVENLNPPKIRTAKSNDNYYLLKNSPCPTVIVECGFLSNWEEATLLCDNIYQEKVASAIVDGILEYVNLFNQGELQ